MCEKKGVQRGIRAELEAAGPFCRVWTPAPLVSGRDVRNWEDAKKTGGTPVATQKKHGSGLAPDPCSKMMVVGEGFEPSKVKPADLQSAPVGHLGIPP